LRSLNINIDAKTKLPTVTTVYCPAPHHHRGSIRINTQIPPTPTVVEMVISKGGGPAIGIDLGTTYSCVAIWRRDRGEVIANDQGNRLTPSCVAFTDDDRLVGEAAVNQAALNPTNTIFGQYYSPFPPF
jgi:hypothetical protein